MKKLTLTLALFFAALPSLALGESISFAGHTFTAYLTSHGRAFHHDWFGGKNTIRVHRGDEYSIVVQNPLPVRVAAAVTVDGLNTIDGESGRVADGTKWIIEPYSSITISGWQTDDNHRRRFVFTEPRHSYARWREYRDGRYYSHKLGEVKIAYFWNSHELNRALHRRHFYYKGHGYSRDSSNAKRRVRPEAEALGDKAGTGMGYRERNPVREVDFHPNTGMYSEHNALTIYYRLAHYNYHPQPHPYPEPPLRYRNYVPEMP